MDSTSAFLTQTVNQAPLNVTAVDKTKVYGAVDPTLTYTVTGLQNNDPTSVVTGVTLATTTGAAATAGTHAITASGGIAANYVISDVSGTLTVAKAAALTARADDKAKAYGAGDPALTYSVTGTLYYGDGPGVVRRRVALDGDRHRHHGRWGAPHHRQRRAPPPTTPSPTPAEPSPSPRRT